MSGWRTVRVFISSTFRDMHAERDHLVKVTFPAIREKLLPHRVELYDIDLRWGITEDEAKNNRVLGLCLEQVDKCRPFFLGFLGNRYGWIPGSITDDVKQQFPFVSQFGGASLTELEIRYGTATSHDGQRTLILLRSEDSLASIPAAICNREFRETDVESRNKLATLRSELQSSLCRVQRYTAVWDAQRYDRVTRTEGRLAHLEEFGRQVEEWLWQSIQTELALPDSPAEIDPLDAESDLHSRFIEVLNRLYVGKDQLYGRLRDFALAGGSKPLLLSGSSGSGKSAALAHFVRQFREEHPDAYLVAHFVGATPTSTSLVDMLARITQELQRKFQFSLPKAESSDEVLRVFSLAVNNIPESSRTILVFDALNQLSADARAESLVWLPQVLPDHVRVLCSSMSGSQKTLRLMAALDDRQCVHVSIEPLNDDERRELIRGMPKLVAKSLNETQIAHLLKNPATENPLFLSAVLEELRGFGSFDHLDQMIATLPADGDVLIKLFVQMFERLEQEFNKPLVETILRCLACSRRGLAEAELVALTRPLGQQSDDLFAVLRQLRPYLQSNNGLIDFYHDSIRRAVEIHYLEWDQEQDQRDPWNRWHPSRQPPASRPSNPEWETRNSLIDFFESQRLDARSVDELPWQLAQLPSCKDLADLLGDLAFFKAAWRRDQIQVQTAWAFVRTLDGMDPLDAYQEPLASPRSHDPFALWDLAVFLDGIGHGKSVLPLWTTFIEYCRERRDDELLGSALLRKAGIVKATGNMDEATQLLNEAMSICNSCHDLQGLQACIGNQAVIMKAIGNWAEAMRLHQEEEAICRQLNDWSALSSCLANQAVLLRQTGDMDKALRMHEEEEAISRRQNDSDAISRSLGHQALIRHDMGDMSGAMELLKVQEAICRQVNNPVGLQGCLVNQSLVMQATGDADAAMRLLQESESICRRINHPSALYHALGNQAGILISSGDVSGGMRLLKEVETICRQLNDLWGLSRSLGNQAAILLTTGDMNAAWRTLKEVEAIARQLKDWRVLVTNLGNQAQIMSGKGDTDGAMKLLRESEAICRQLNHPEGLVVALYNQSQCHLATRDVRRAREGLRNAEEALSIAREHNLEFLVGKIEPFVIELTRLLNEHQQ